MIRESDLLKQWRLIPISLVGLLMVACGGGGSSQNTDTSITGSVVAAPVSGASMLVKDTGGNTIAGPVTTASDGAYSVDVPDSSLAGVLIFESTGGTYTDEATGQSGNAGTLSAYVSGGNLSAGSAVHLTPASSIVQRMVADHSMTLSAAQSAFDSAFGFADDTSIAPADATNPTGSPTQAELLAGLRAAAFSQLNMDLGLTVSQQFDLLAALAEDLSDGSLDGGVTASLTLPADIQNRFTMAIMNFHGSTNDATGLANNMIGGTTFAKVGLSDLADGSPGSYKVEYIPGMMMTMEGKTMFTLRILNLDGTPATGLTPTLMPMMHMTDGEGKDMMHSSPSDGCMATDAAGETMCTVYYLMASNMANGMSMGYWELMVMPVMGESTTFYPQVMMDMNMGNTLGKVILKGLTTGTDMIAGMMMPENRTYYLFRDGLSGTTGNHTFDLFVAAKESMDSYPAVSVGTVLNSGDASYELTADPMTVEVSSDESTWVAATDGGSGHWSVTGITGLTDGSAGTLFVRVTITSEQKTTDGAAQAGNGTNDYARFTVTP